MQRIPETLNENACQTIQAPVSLADLTENDTKKRQCVLLGTQLQTHFKDHLNAPNSNNICCPAG